MVERKTGIYVGSESGAGAGSPLDLDPDGGPDPTLTSSDRCSSAPMILIAAWLWIGAIMGTRLDVLALLLRRPDERFHLRADRSSLCQVAPVCWVGWWNSGRLAPG